MEAQVQQLASAYLTKVKPTGNDGLRATCPLCGSDRAFIISLSHGGWICWSCGERGALATLLRRLGMTEKQVARVVDSADLPPALSERMKRRLQRKKGWGLLPEYLLGAFQDVPPELVDLGFSSELLREHDVGLDYKNDRITFAIRDNLGRLAGISGRARNNRTVPRYKVYDASPPDPRIGKLAGELYGAVDGYTPDNRSHLYGYNTVYPERYFSDEVSQPPLVITEGYKSTLWLRQMGVAHAVGLQGSSVTQSQLRMLGKLNGPYYVMLDNEPGKGFPDKYRRCAAVDIVRKLQVSGRVYVCLYDERRGIGTAPDDIREPEELREMINSAKTLGQLVTERHRT